MSADKHKKRDRAFAWLRKRRWNGHPIDTVFDGPLKPSGIRGYWAAQMSTIMWLVERGFGRIERRSRTGVRNRRNHFVENE